MALEPYSVKVIESLERARSQESPSADRLVITPSAVAVVDGSTPKPWEKGSPFDGCSVADEVARAIKWGAARRIGDESWTSWEESLTAAVAGLADLADWPASTRGCATVAIVDAVDRLVWRLGDPWVMIDGTVHSPRPTAEQSLAELRSRVAESLLRGGMSVEELQRNDVARAEILEDLKLLAQQRNDPAGSGFGAIDGLAVPLSYVEVLPLPPTECEVVLATDGYPEICSTLEESERRLRGRLAEDPLLIGQPPQTKGVSLGAQSYDDRTFVRCTVEGQRS